MQGKIKSTVDGLEKLRPGLIKLYNDLQALLVQAKKQRSDMGRRKSNTQYNLSKRAVELSKIPSVEPNRKSKVQSKRGPGVPRSQSTQNLQQVMNNLAVFKKVRSWVEMDGQYGPNTATALVALLNYVPGLEERMLRKGLSKEIASDVAKMNKYPGYITVAYGALREQYLIETGQKSQMSQRKQKPEGFQYKRPQGASILPEPCDLNEKNPSDGQILGCLMDKGVIVGGGRISLYDYMARRRMNHESMVDLAKKIGRGKRPGDWDDKMLRNFVDAIGGRYTISPY